MILPIYIYGSGVLREKAAEVDLNNTEGLPELIDNMYQTMRESDGVGIAAPQVGKSIRLLIVDGADLAEDMPELEGFKRVMINPELLWESEQTCEYSEGCLSVPGKYGITNRPMTVTVRAQDRYGKWFELSGEDLLARAFCHETDHLDGKVFIDLARDLPAVWSSTRWTTWMAICLLIMYPRSAKR